MYGSPTVQKSKPVELKGEEIYYMINTVLAALSEKPGVSYNVGPNAVKYSHINGNLRDNSLLVDGKLIFSEEVLENTIESLYPEASDDLIRVFKKGFKESRDDKNPSHKIMTKLNVKDAHLDGYDDLYENIHDCLSFPDRLDSGRLNTISFSTVCYNIIGVGNKVISGNVFKLIYFVILIGKINLNGIFFELCEIKFIFTAHHGNKRLHCITCICPAVKFLSGNSSLKIKRILHTARIVKHNRNNPRDMFGRIRLIRRKYESADTLDKHEKSQKQSTYFLHYSPLRQIKTIYSNIRQI
jgi:hypothetical protein